MNAFKTPRFAVSNLPDAHIEPAPFTTHGTLSGVIKSTVDAIAREQGRDVVAKGQQTKLSPRNGALTFDDGTVTRFGYTHGAYEQLTEKIHGTRVQGTSFGGLTHTKQTTPSKFADVALWASPKLRNQMHDEMTSLGHRRNVNQVFRIARDAHNKDAPTVEYIRAVVSERHSAANGDDVAFLAALGEFVAPVHFAEFHQGAAYLRRDPAGETVGRVDSAKKLPGNARLTVSFTNNEIGEGAARVGMALTFEVEATVDGLDAKPTRIEIELPGKRGQGRSVHLGSGPSHMFSGFAESLMLALGWAPSALEKMRTIRFDAARCTVLRELVTKDLTGAALREKQTAIGAFLIRLEADGTAPINSVLSIVVMLTHFGKRLAAQDLVTEFAGGF